MQQNKANWRGDNRRKLPVVKDKLFKIMIGVNVVGWMVFIAALLVFHYARPEFISGAQDFWGITGREDWSVSLSFYLVSLLVGCVGLSLAVLLLKQRRTRRQNDYFGINGFVLLIVASISLTILYFEFN